MDLSTRAEKRNTVEHRAVTAREFELRDSEGGNSLTFTGYASVTDTPYEMEDWLGPYTEVIRQGAFGKTLAEGADVPFKLNHGGMTLARTKSGTMKLSEDDHGLHVEAQLDPRNSAVRDLQSAMERGDIDEMSFGFRVIRQEWSPDYTQRDITEVSLNKGDVSVVNYGANPATAGASMRSRDIAAALAEWRKSADPADVDRLMRSLADEPDNDLAAYLAAQSAKRAASYRV